MHKYFLLESLVKNVGTAVADGLSFGIASGLKNSWNEIAEHTRTTNDVIYYMQVKTFLETVDLDQEQVTEFFENNPDHQRLGIEIFKILENTFLEQQAKFIAQAFKKFVRHKISSEILYEYIHVTEKLNRHVLNLIEKDLKNFNLYYVQHDLEMDLNELGVMNFFSTNVSRDHVLQSIGFTIVESSGSFLKFSAPLKSEATYRRTQLYLNFYRDIIRDSENI
ncbi:hypothetical protein [Acinetobacter ursingii]|nr:hypothetical protein [Acinetobacter ursingii]MCU4483910.1 hypothetical protein [Acinetobacter ursingii]MCU4508239.1 hypothetical protein [Acinetobacter ursingii]MCU4570756.1 hypothetical protein [Acinetobacter ursingii]